MYRKTNKTKRVDNSCKNHGSCLYCKNSRLHNSKVRELSADEQVDEEDNACNVDNKGNNRFCNYCNCEFEQHNEYAKTKTGHWICRGCWEEGKILGGEGGQIPLFDGIWHNKQEVLKEVCGKIMKQYLGLSFQDALDIIKI